MKTFKTILIGCLFILSALTLGACSNPQPTPNPECKPQIQITHDIQYVDREVPCKDSNVTCEFSGTGAVPFQKSLECIKTLKQALRACSAEMIK